MTKVVPISDQNALIEEANRWVLRLEEGLSAPDEAALGEWLAADPEHLAVFLEAAKAWDESAVLARLADIFPRNSTAPQRRPRWALPAVAATVALAVGLVALDRLPVPSFNGSQEMEQAAQSLHTAIGEQKTMALADGSVVVLNTDSEVRVAFDSDARVLHLLRGEIHISVADDPSRPFSVVAGDHIVQAIGTSFSVEITQDQRVDLVVTEGTVVVGIHAPGSQAEVTPPILAQTEGNTVEAGEGLLLGDTDNVVVPVTAEEIEVKLAWRYGSLMFSSEPLEDALMEMERYTTVRFVFVDEELKARSVSGRFRAGDVEALLVALRINFDIGHEITNDGRVLLSQLQAAN